MKQDISWTHIDTWFIFSYACARFETVLLCSSTSLPLYLSVPVLFFGPRRLLERYFHRERPIEPSNEILVPGLHGATKYWEKLHACEGCYQTQLLSTQKTEGTTRVGALRTEHRRESRAKHRENERERNEATTSMPDSSLLPSVVASRSAIQPCDTVRARWASQDPERTTRRRGLRTNEVLVWVERWRLKRGDSTFLRIAKPS